MNHLRRQSLYLILLKVRVPVGVNINQLGTQHQFDVVVNGSMKWESVGVPENQLELVENGINSWHDFIPQHGWLAS